MRSHELKKKHFVLEKLMFPNRKLLTKYTCETFSKRTHSAKFFQAEKIVHHHANESFHQLSVGTLRLTTGIFGYFVIFLAMFCEGAVEIQTVPFNIILAKNNI